MLAAAEPPGTPGSAAAAGEALSGNERDGSRVPMEAGQWGIHSGEAWQGQQ